MKEKDKKPTLKEVIEGIKKKYGEGAVISHEDVPSHVESIPTGCFALDNLLGCGGLPKGRLMEVYGENSSGKSTMCLFFSAQVQKQGGKVVYIDAENAFDASYAQNIGVDTTELLVSQPTTLEETMDIVKMYVETSAVDLIIVDSVASLVPKAELEGEFMKETMAVQARAMSKALRILTGPIAKSKTVVIFINQLREKVGVFYGEKTTTPGGKALKFYSSVRIAVTKGEKILGKNDEHIGNRMKLTATKNKVGMPFRKAEFDLYYSKGIDLLGDAFDYAVSLEIIKKAGNTYMFNNQKLGVGRDNARSYMADHEEVYADVRKALEVRTKELDK
jgi:recombination protein RecA